ncbi:hypothetical protein FRB94_010180 [Tulasnella sp. JGI-2019a]|nr:hypothetical protein FRB94_010180 [Tulasnella sp. JGI-2019a]
MDTIIPIQVQNSTSVASPLSSNRTSSKETDGIKFTPISILTEDVLVEIFRIASALQSDWPSNKYVKVLLAMAQVCSTWATIIMRTPILWPLVHFDTRSDGTEWATALERSQPSRIAVECFSDSRKLAAPFWSAITIHSHRWDSLTVTVVKGGSWVDLDGIRSPFLGELRLSLPGRWRRLDISSHNFPNISTLTLRGASLRDWDSGLLSGLRYLTLGALHNPPSSQQLLNMLAASPRLEHLEISKMDPHFGNVSSCSPPISLPDLRNLEFKDLPATVIDVILRSLHAAYCPALYLTTTSTPSQLLNLSWENFPVVSRLILICVDLRDWGSGLLSGLHHLYLSETSDYPPSLQQLLDMLIASPHLEQLHLLDIDPTVNNTSICRPPIQLPVLRTLKFVRIPIIIINTLLQSLHAVYCPTVYMYIHSETMEMEPPIPAIISFLTPSLTHYLATAQKAIRLTLCDRSFVFSVDPKEDARRTQPTLTIDISFLPVEMNAILDWVNGLPQLNTSDPSLLQITVKFWIEGMEDRFRAAKWPLTNIDTIVIDSQGTTFCQVMSFPVDLGDRRYRWLGPNVRKIVFEKSWRLDGEAVLEMVRRRTTASRGVDHGSLTPLEEVVISSECSIAKISAEDGEAGKQQMSRIEVMEAARTIISEGVGMHTD